MTSARSAPAASERGRLLHLFVRRRRLVQMTVDAAAWIVVVPTAAALRFDFDLAQLRFSGIAAFIAIVLVLHGVVGANERLYSGRYSFGAFEEVAGLTRTVVVVSITAAVVNHLVVPHPVPRRCPSWPAGWRSS